MAGSPADTVQAYYSLLLATPENPVCCSATGALRPETVTVSVAPEPTTWAMLLLGFGVMGGALRRAGATAPLGGGT